MSAGHKTTGMTTTALHTTMESDRWDCSVAVAPPIVHSANYRMPGTTEGDGVLVYHRYGNPSLHALQGVLAALEGGKHACCFATGMAANTAVVNLLKQGDHVVAGKEIYGGIFDMFKNYLPTIGVEVTFADGTDVSSVVAALRPNTRLTWFEPCTNPLATFVDVQAIAQAVHEYRKDIIVAVDNTFLTPYALKPLSLGVDLVYHSCSKYIGGHSDILMGCLVANCDQLIERLRYIQRTRGLTPSSFDCYLVHRSTYTLELRMRQHEESSLAVAKFLSSHPAVQKVIHPQLPSHPQHNIAKKLLGDRYSGMVPFYIKGGDAEAVDFLMRLKVVLRAASLGGVHSVANKPTSLSHVYLSQEEKEAANITDNLIRLSVGLENTGDIINDIDKALRAAVLKEKVES